MFAKLAYILDPPSSIYGFPKNFSKLPTLNEK